LHRQVRRRRAAIEFRTRQRMRVACQSREPLVVDRLRDATFTVRAGVNTAASKPQAARSATGDAEFILS